MVQARLELLRAGRIAGFGALTATLLSAFALRHRLAPDNERYDLQNLWVGRWSRALLTLFGVDLRVYGQVSPPKGCGRVIISNHRSTLDVGVLLSIFGGHMVSRADLARWPLMGLAAREAGTIFVDRANAASGAGAIRAMTEVLRRGHTVVVFAEGTTFADDEVRPFHGGAFVAAVVAKAEVLPRRTRLCACRGLQQRSVCQRDLYVPSGQDGCIPIDACGAPCWNPTSSRPQGTFDRAA